MSSHSCSIQHGISIIVKSCILENAKIARVGRVEAISFIVAKKEIAIYIYLQGLGSKMLVNSTEGACDLKEHCKYGYDLQAKGREWASRPTLTPNP